jgi:L-threonylcarbamoyladenylate synthase
MKTKVYAIDPNNPDAKLIRKAADIIQKGGLVAFPTETVYGLGANAIDAMAVERVFAAKQRPTNDPLIVHIHDDRQVALVARDVTALCWRLACAFWPGALTLVLPRRDLVPALVSSGLPTVAVRMPSGAVARALLKASEQPIAAPSANSFSRPSATTAEHVLHDLDGRIDMVLDGGACAMGLESTVVDLTTPVPTVLRPGAIPLEALREVLPTVQMNERYIPPGADEAGAAPGMQIKHYAPRAQVLLFAGERKRALPAIQKRLAQLLAQGKPVGLLLVDEDAEKFAESGGTVEKLGSQKDLVTVGSRLFSGLRALDAAGVAVILARALDREGLGAAIYDRLLRAAVGQVIES